MDQPCPLFFTMPVQHVRGDPLLTTAQFIAFGHNARGRSELGAFETALFQRNPAAFANFQRQCRKGRVQPGTYWLWREAKPSLAFLVIRNSSVGAARLRYVQSVLLALARDYRREQMQSLAIAPLGHTSEEWPEIRPMIDQWLDPTALSVMVYDAYIAGVRAEEAL